MTTELVTKADSNALNRELKLACESLKQEIELFRSSMKQEMDLLLSSITIRFGTMLAFGLGLLFAALKLT